MPQPRTEEEKTLRKDSIFTKKNKMITKSIKIILRKETYLVIIELLAVSFSEALIFRHLVYTVILELNAIQVNHITR